MPEENQPVNLVAGMSKSPRLHTKNLDDIKSSLRKAIMSDSAKILAENQKEMLKLIEPPSKKLINLPETEYTDSETENVLPKITSTPVKTETPITKTTPVNSRNNHDVCSFFLKLAKSDYVDEVKKRKQGSFSCLCDVLRFTFVKKFIQL